MKALKSFLIWGLVVLVGVIAFATLALSRGEHISTVWLVVAAVSVYCIAYRSYSLYICKNILELDARCMTPAGRHNNGVDYVPTNEKVLFGHHFAAIAGAGPPVGPALASQMGYPPGTLWIISGVTLTGAVQDMMVLLISMRRDGKSLGDIIKQELDTTAGIIASTGIPMIMIIITSVLTLIVVKALTHSSWGTFIIAATAPIALFMGVYVRFIRPGRIGEISTLGSAGLLCAVIFGNHVAQSPIDNWFNLDGVQLAIGTVLYGDTSSLLPVWLLMTPRDYLTTFLKIGTILALTVGVIIVGPELKMPIVTHFIDGSGPVFAGGLFPFLLITIACGAVSGFHMLIPSGTAPKMIENEIHVRAIGCDGVLMESFVATMALSATCVLESGVYFAMDSPAALVGADAADAAQVITNQLQAPVDAVTLLNTAKEVGEHTILSRAGGTPTLAVGMVHIMNQLIPGEAMMTSWYHFALLFETMFILTAVDAGTHTLRFMFQDLLDAFFKLLGTTGGMPANAVATLLTVGSWGYFLYAGVIDPLGGINSFWPLFGVGNQVLAGIMLIMAAVVLMKMKKERFIWISIIPAIGLLVTTAVASVQKLFDDNLRVSFSAHAAKYRETTAAGQVLSPAKDISQMGQIVLNDYANSGLCAIFMLVMLFVTIYGLVVALKARKVAQPTAEEIPAVYRDEVQNSETAV